MRPQDAHRIRPLRRYSRSLVFSEAILWLFRRLPWTYWNSYLVTIGAATNPSKRTLSPSGRRLLLLLP